MIAADAALRSCIIGNMGGTVMRYVVLYGDHGGELDREPVTASYTHATSEAVIRLAQRCTLEPGDHLVIEEELHGQA